jgi:hypothetical protein
MMITILKIDRMEPHWKETKRKAEKTMDGGRVGDLRIMKIKNWKQKAINREA